MMRAESRRYLGWILLIAGPLVTVVVNPWTSYDPINLPKFAMMLALAGIALALLVMEYRNLLLSRYRPTLLLSALLTADLLVVLLTSSSPFNQQFFGTFGRNTGFLAYLALLILFFAATVGLDKSGAEKLLWNLVGTGYISALYGLIQIANWDPIKWKNPFSHVIGFLGNPDFQSSFLGICVVAAVALVLRDKCSWRRRGVLVSYLVIAIYVIAETRAIQGFFVVAIGIAVVGYLYIHGSKPLKLLTVPYLLLISVAGIFVVIGSLNKGPLAHYLYKASVTFRGDYWRAGWKMTLDHPLGGIGLDSYGDWYRSTRTLAATVRRGPDITSNAAHNVFLDFSSNGGFPLLIAYLLIIGLTLVSAIRVMRRTVGFDATHAALFGAWVAYLAQSTISLNQLGVAVWGWILSGALIAYEINTRVVDELPSDYSKVSKGRRVNIASSTPATSVAIFFGLVLGLILGLPPFIADAKFRTALSSHSASALASAATSWPMDIIRLEQGAIIMRNSKLEPQALLLGKRAAQYDPHSYTAWWLIYTSSSSTKVEKAAALVHMKYLDPENRGLK